MKPEPHFLKSFCRSDFLCMQFRYVLFYAFVQNVFCFIFILFLFSLAWFFICLFSQQFSMKIIWWKIVFSSLFSVLLSYFQEMGNGELMIQIWIGHLTKMAAGAKRMQDNLPIYLSQCGVRKNKIIIPHWGVKVINIKMSEFR